MYSFANCNYTEILTRILLIFVPRHAAPILALVPLRTGVGWAGLWLAHPVQADLPRLALGRAGVGPAQLVVVVALLAEGAVADGRGAVGVLHGAAAPLQAGASSAFLKKDRELG